MKVIGECAHDRDAGKHFYFALIKYHFVFDDPVLYIFEFIDNVYIIVVRDKEDNIIIVLVNQISSRQSL